jgi:hypothetical protein
LHYEEKQDFYSSDDIWAINTMSVRWAGHVARMEETRGAYWVFVGRPEGNRQSGRPRCGWEDNFKINL